MGMRAILPQRCTRPILVVDDDAGVREVCSDLLRALGFESRGVRSGQAALQALDGVDVVLLDLQMPSMDGGQVLRAMRALRPDLKIVMMSGRPREDLGRWLDSGAQGVLRKPFGLGDLDRSMASLCL